VNTKIHLIPTFHINAEKMEYLLNKIKPDCVAVEMDYGPLEDLTTYIAAKVFSLVRGGRSYAEKQKGEADAITKYCEENQIPLYYIDTSYWRQFNKMFFIFSFINPLLNKYLKPKRIEKMRDLRRDWYGKIMYAMVKNRNIDMDKNIKFIISIDKYKKIACIVGKFHVGDEYFGLEKLLTKQKD
jgi:hypothetical protein